ncbi:MAG: DUF4254 domain-containing protein [Gemmataceae bacterium]
MFNVEEITNLQHHTVALWHEQETANPYSGFLGLVCEQHKFNYLLWHEEDIARSPDVGDTRVAQVKRTIDKYNQQRNDCIEKLDDYLIRELGRRNVIPEPKAVLNTETPGSVIDRLSIMALRIYHMHEQVARTDVTPEHITKIQNKLAILAVQHQDLSHSLGELLNDIGEGRKRLKVYRQFKMYNDPTLNPYLYRQPRKAG